MNPKELREKRAKAVADAQALIPTTGSMSAESRVKFDAFMGEADTLKGDIDRLERAAAAEAEMRATQAPPNPTIGAPGAASNEAEETQRKAFRNFLRSGFADANLTEDQIQYQIKTFRGRTVYDFQPARQPWAFESRQQRVQSILTKLQNSSEKRDSTFADFMGISVGSPVGSLGGFFVPQGFVYDVDIATKWYGDILADATTIETATGQPLPYPTSNDTTVTGSWLGEGVQVNPVDINIGHIMFGAYKLSTNEVPVSLELLQDSAFDLETFVKNAFAIRLGRSLNEAFTTGNGTGLPTGLMVAATDSGQTVIGDENQNTPNPVIQIGYDDIVNLEHSVDKSYRKGAKYMAHDSTIRALKLLKDKYGRPLWTPGIAVAAPDTINGYPISTNNDMDQLGPSPAAYVKTLAFGRIDKYLIRKVKELSVVRLVERFADYGIIAFLGFARYDGNLIDAGTHPVMYLTSPASEVSSGG